MKLKTSDLTGAALDWAVATCEGWSTVYTASGSWYLDSGRLVVMDEECVLPFSSDWALGGPIIEQERMEVDHDGFKWWARIRADEDFEGSSLLQAAMRCYVSSKLGDEIEVPDELIGESQ